MLKRGSFSIKSAAVANIFLIVFASVAFAFLLSETNFSAAQNTQGLWKWCNSCAAGGKWISVSPRDVQIGDYVSYDGFTNAGQWNGNGASSIIPNSAASRPAGVASSLSAAAPATNLIPTGTSNGLFSADATKIIQAHGIDPTLVTQGPNGEWLISGQSSGYFNPNTPGLADGLKTFDPATGQISTAGQDVPGTFTDLLGIESPGLGALVEGLGWGLSVYLASTLITGLLGLEEGTATAINTALGLGTFAGTTFAKLIEYNIVGSGGEFLGISPLGAGLLVGGLTAVIVFALLYSSESKRAVKFQCLPFEPPVGGKDCERCNGDPFRPCSEYRCRALGQACEIVNAGSEDEKCVWVNPNDSASPTITPWTTPLTQGHKYTSHDTRPPARGTKIVKTGAANGCLQAFTPLTFGFTTNEPAQCKIDIVHTNSSDTMQYYVGNTNLFLYNHTQTMSLPSPGAINAEAPQLQNDGRYNLFVRCRDKNGNENVDEFAVQFCVDPSPDTTPPVIVDTSIRSGSPVTFGVNNVPLQVYVNEPATCKWSKQNKNYDEMETAMTCASSLTQINARELYTCATTLTGVQNNVANSFYFRCKDQPSKPENSRNVNVNSYNFTLKGSQPLNIISTAPNTTITGSATSVNVELKVTTDDGAEEGKAICSFSATNEPGSFIEMFETNNFEHKQLLQLGSGNYNYYFRCVDLGGNSATSTTAFTVFVDTQPPAITRAYHDQANNALKIVTNEEATCTYSLSSCNYNFAEGIVMPYANPSLRRNHYAEWQPNIVYYIKCRDDFGNEPAPNSCSIIASATSIG